MGLPSARPSSKNKKKTLHKNFVYFHKEKQLFLYFGTLKKVFLIFLEMKSRSLKNKQI